MQIEHVNITVPDPKASAAKLCELFGLRSMPRYRHWNRAV